MKNTTTVSNKNFGIVFSIFFLILFLYFLIFKNLTSISLLSLSLIFLSLGLFSSPILTPLKNIWMSLGIFLGKFVSPIVLFFLYFTLVLLTKVILSIFKKDPMGLNVKNNYNSYWIKKDKKKTNMDLQF